MQLSKVRWKRQVRREDKMLGAHPLIVDMGSEQFLNLGSLTIKKILSSCSKLQTTLVVIAKAIITRRSMREELAMLVVVVVVNW